MPAMPDDRDRDHPTSERLVDRLLWNALARIEAQLRVQHDVLYALRLDVAALRAAREPAPGPHRYRPDANGECLVCDDLADGPLHHVLPPAGGEEEP